MIFDALKKSIKRKWWLYLILFFTTIIIVILELLPAKLLEHIINDYLSVDNKEAKLLIELSILYVASIVLALLFDFLKQILLITIGEEFTYEIRRKMANKLKKIPTTYFSDEDSGVTSSRFTSDVDQINSFFSNGIISMSIDLLKIIAILAAMFYYSVYLGLLTLAFIPFIYLISRLFKKLMFKSQKKSRVMIGYVNNHISETIKNERMIKIYNKEEYMVNKNQEYLDSNYKSQVKVSFFDSIYSPIIQIITALVIVILVITTNLNPILGISIGALAGAIEYVTQLFTPIENIGMEIQSIQKALSGISRVKEFLALKEEDSKLKPTECDSLNNELVLEFNDVSFTYDGEANVLNNITIKANHNSKVSFTGRTGVGKTTMFKLIEGELKPTSGTIEINGIPTYKIPDELKSKVFGYVSQSFNPLSYESIADNITMKNESITTDMIIDSLKLVGLYDKISSLKDGINTIFKEASFSFGEKELINIARAIVNNPRILLLDEMTSGLDSITEGMIVEALEKASEGRMILQISHRLATTLNSDYIVYLKDGKVESISTPNEFLKTDYAKNTLILEKNWN